MNRPTRLQCAHCALRSLPSLRSTSHVNKGYCSYHWAGQLRHTPGDVPPDMREDWLAAVASATKPKLISDVIRTSGGTFYRNKKGRCVDAPCCGCCTI